MRKTFLTFAGCLLALAGCTAETASGSVECDQPGDVDCSPLGPGSGKSDEWNSINDPARWAQTLIYKLEDLPREGQAERVAWASTYWPYYEDSTNVRWQGPSEMSPMEKYDLAFNGWTPPEGFMELDPMSRCGDAFDQAYYDALGPAASWMSENKGNYAMRDGRDSDGDGQVDECGDDYDGIEGWWGLCHAWVPAAILEPEPMGPVTENGVTFEVSDLTALLITAYDRTNALMLGGRCNAREVEREDNTTRAVPSECRDTNAGAFHVIITNFIGLRKKAIAEDRTYNFEVWNQPLTAYEITKLEEIDAAQAQALVGGSGDTYSYNPRAVRFAEVEMTTSYITESHASREPTTDHIDQYTRHDYYHYVLEIDANGKIIGGEWAESSHSNHPDFLWLPIAAGWGANPHVDLEKVRDLVRRSLLEDDGRMEDEPPAAVCDGAYRDSNDRCRLANGRFAPVHCCL